MKILEPKPPGTLWATPGLLRDSFTFNFYMRINFFSYPTLRIPPATRQTFGVTYYFHLQGRRVRSTGNRGTDIWKGQECVQVGGGVHG